MGDPLRFEGRVALVTGGGTGIGREQALLLAARGARVAINGRAHGTARIAAMDVCDEIRARGGDAIVVVGTVGDDADARAMVDAAVERWGRIDIIVNNAGTAGQPGPIEAEPTASLERELDVHLRGPLQINRAAWPHMVRQRHGRLLFTGSSCALGWYEGPGGFEGDYAIAKSTLFAATRQTAGSGAPHGIHANLVMPWAFTPQVARTLGDTSFSRWMENTLGPERIAAASLFLLHENCPANGEIISVAGGRITRILFASPEGMLDAAFTPETVRDRWDLIYGQVDADRRIADMVEVRGQPGEFALISESLRALSRPSEEIIQ